MTGLQSHMTGPDPRDQQAGMLHMQHHQDCLPGTPHPVTLLGQGRTVLGLDKPHGRPTQSLRHAAAAGAAAKPVSKPADQVRGRLGRESPRSDTSTGAGTAPEGNSQRLAGPSRFGPGRAISRELPVEQEPNRLGKKRRFQVQLYPQICQLTTNVRHCRHLTLLFLVLVSRKSLSLSGCLPVSCAVLGRSQVSQE